MWFARNRNKRCNEKIISGVCKMGQYFDVVNIDKKSITVPTILGMVVKLVKWYMDYLQRY